jgi:hypothetical protein
MNGDHVGLLRPAAPGEPDPASEEGLAADFEPKNGEALLQAEDALLDRDSLGVSLGEDQVDQIASLGANTHRPARG